ncbi:hypothetical protein BKA59DRAFT_119104 [Fusarium tricinctum]|uniref:2EXR domain-containing protein n=1 Tax=Fusarium tricinctum TaxID=61284 RepID=A0A8K0SA63_9HYPO|nr:hypothetical protein BKA59DRAFT_119104 [Fusarium tricinctum]
MTHGVAIMSAPNLDSDAQAGVPDQQLLSPKQTSSSSETLIETTEPPVKFEIPHDCRTFAPFARLPPEIRAQIWQSTLDTPGMHFLKIDTDWHPATGIGRWWIKESHLLHNILDEEGENIDPIALEVKREIRPTSKVHATLKPLYPTPQADISYYTNLHQQLAKLSVTCNESATISRSLTDRPTTFRLDSGRIVSLNTSSDVIYLEYVPPDIYEDNIRFSKALSCPGLDQVRKVAVRYCHKWYERQLSRRCPNCGQIHNVPAGMRYPRHLYRFLAQYLPNLEQFYFVDYLILRKSPGIEEQTLEESKEFSKNVVAKPGTCRFEGGNRSYFEADAQDWNVNSRVFKVNSWLQEQFVKYAKTSKLSKHKNPEKVKFGVLACEWNVEPPTEPKKAPAMPIKKGRNKRAHSEERPLSRARRLSIRRGTGSVTERLPYSLTAQYPFVFDAGGSNKFEFTFSMPL